MAGQGADAGAAVAGVVEVAPNVYALGGDVLLDRPLPWVPAGYGGVDACCCYLIVEGNEGLLIDCGLPAHGDRVLPALRALLPSGGSLQVLVTRHEPECFGNLRAVLNELPVARMYGFGQNPAEFFQPEALHPSVPIQRLFVLKDLDGEILLAGRRRIALLPAAIGALRTGWPHDARTGILFSSDLFGWVHRERVEHPWVTETVPPQVDAEWVADHLAAKFAWLHHARVHTIRAALAHVFDERDVTVLAPTHGTIVRGRQAAADQRRLLEAAMDVLLSRAAPAEDGPATA